jgi:hypothetical protein
MISAQEHLGNLVTQAYYRELEVYTYQTNIDNYTIMLTGLPEDEFPADLASFSNVETAQLPASLSDAEVETISQYQFRDKLKASIRTEVVEQSKAKLILAAVKAQIITGGLDYDTALSAKKTSEEAKAT